MRISHQLVPAGGWKFQVGKIEFTGYSFDDLVKIVIKHQKANDLPISTVEDIEDFIADKHPYLIINGDKLKKKSMGVSFYQTVQSFVQFLNNWYLKGGKLVDQNTANIRANICIQCHNNQASTETRAKSCCGGNKVQTLVINKVRAQIIKDNRTPMDAKLLTCGICGCCSKISVWIPNNILVNTGDANAYPSFCWKKKVLEGTDI